jgi:hypothetical protein
MAYVPKTVCGFGLWALTRNPTYTRISRVTSPEFARKWIDLSPPMRAAMTFCCAGSDIRRMPIGQSSGELIARIYGRTCGRSVQIDPARLPPAPITERYRRRLHGMKCGGRGADIRIAWTIPPPQHA